MKRFLVILTVLSLLISLCACSKQSTKQTANNEPVENTEPSYKVPNPMKIPVYTFNSTPSTDELREMAIKGMRDLLSIQWHTATEIAYYKTGPMSQKRFEHLPKNIYAGTLYSNASTGIFQFMEFYNQETGQLEYPGQAHEMKEAIGNSCADSLLWGWSVVCNSITGGFFPMTMVYSNGYIPVGGYTYDFTVDNYNKYPTHKIVKDNGADAILEAYTQVQLADALVSSTANHAMMVVGRPHVYYNDDGSIDTANSYVPIQDQRAGSGEGFYEIVEDGYLVHYSGRTVFNFTFKDLIDKHYVPVTTAEFLGTKPYDTATATITNANCASIDDLLRCKVSSNYPLAIVRVTVIDEKGTETIIARELFGGAATTGVPRTFALSYMDALVDFSGNALNKAGNSVKLEVVVSTGETFTLADFSI